MNVWFWKTTKAGLWAAPTVSRTGVNPQWNNNGAIKSHWESVQVLTINNFRSALSDGFLIKLHTHAHRKTKLNADSKTAAVSWSQILPKHQISLGMLLQSLGNQQTEGSVVDHIIGLIVTYVSEQSTPGSAWVARSKNAAHHFDTKSWKSLEKTPSGSLGGGWGGSKRSGSNMNHSGVRHWFMTPLNLQFHY